MARTYIISIWIKIFPASLTAIKKLNENKIPHVMSEELLAEDDLNKIFDKTVELYDWHNNIEKNKITTSEDVNYIWKDVFALNFENFAFLIVR